MIQIHLRLLGYLLCCCFVFSMSAYAQRPVMEWEKAYGGTGLDILNDMCLTSSGGYIFAGQTQSNDGDISHLPVRTTGKNDGWVVMLDQDRNIIWSKCYGGTDDDQLFSVQPTADGNYIVAGFTASNNGHISGNRGAEDAWMMKLNSEGDTLWSRSYGGSGNDQFQYVVPAIDGGYIAVGYTASNDGDVSGNHGATDGWVVKTDANGNIQWQKCYGGTEPDQRYLISEILYKIRPLSDNSGYVLVGYTHSSDGDISLNKGGADYWIVKINLQGDVQWSKCYGSSLASVPFVISEVARDVIVTPDNGFLVTGFSQGIDGDVSVPWGGGQTDMWVIKLDEQGNLQWERSYGGTGADWGFSLALCADGNYLLGGAASSKDGDLAWKPLNGYQDNSWVLKISPTGDILWDIHLGNEGGVEWVKSLYELPDGSIVVGSAVQGVVEDAASVLRIGISSSMDAWIFKLTSCPAHEYRTITICEGDVYDFNGALLTESGVYLDTTGRDGACPNYIELNLTVRPKFTPVITRHENLLSTDTYRTYQWFLDGTPLSWAKAQSVNVEGSGNYSLSVTDDIGCKSNTTEAYSFLYDGCEAPASEWSKTYGGTNTEHAYSIVALNDGYLITGRTNSEPSDTTDVKGLHGTSYDVWIIKISNEGDTLWTKTLGGEGNDYGYSVRATSDGGFVVLGQSAYNAVTGDVTASRPISEAGGADVWVLKFNASGEEEWQHLYGGVNTDVAYSIEQLTDGYIIAGAVHNSSTGGTWDELASNGGYDGWILKLKTDGTLDWQKRLGGGGAEYLYSVKPTTDNGYIAVGYSAYHATTGTLGETPRPISGGGGNDIWVIKLNNTGETVWQKLFGGGDADIAYSVQQTTDGGYILAGYSASANGTLTGKSKPSGNDFYILKLNATGDTLWTKVLGGTASDQALSYDIIVEADGYVFAGISASVNGDVTGNKGSDDAWVVKTDLNGHIVWQKTLGGKSADRALSIVSANGGGYVVAGYATNIEGGKGGADFYIVKLSGCRTCTEIAYVSICENKTYEFNGESISAQGVYTRDVSGEEGCTQIEGLKLSHLPAYTVVQDASICSGETFEFYDQALSESGSYIHVLRSEAGCDSTISLRFVVHELPVPEIMGDENNTLVTGQYAGYKWFYNNADLGSEDNNVQAGQTGYYRVAVTDGNGCSDTSNALFVGIPVLDAFDLEGRYVWKFTIPGMGDQVSAQEYHADRIDYRMTGNAYANDYSMTMESYDGEEGRWIGVGSGGTSIVKDGIYYVLFFREYRGDSVLVYKHECESREEAYMFAYPSEDAVSDYGWNWYVRDAGTGMYSLSGGHFADIYPNPVESKVEVRHSYSGAVSFRLLDTYGRLVGSSSNGASIDMSGCSSGVYLLQIYEDNVLRYTGRIIKQ